MIKPSSAIDQDFLSDRCSETADAPFDKQCKSHLQQALNAAQIGIWDRDLATDMVTWSTASERLFGLMPGAFSGMVEDLGTLSHPDDRAAMHEAITRASVEHTEYSAEFRVLWPDGSVHWLRTNGQFLYNERGQAIHSTGTVIEITESKEAAHALQRSQERYRAISELTSDYASAYLLDAAGELQLDWMSDAFTRVTGFTVEELAERGWQALIHPDDFAEAIAVVERTLAGQEAACENRIITKSGATRIIRNYSRPMWGPDGVIRGVYGAACDITEYKQLEAEREQLLHEALQRADRDPLTGLYNHRAFHKALEEEAARAMRQGSTLAVAMLDLDNFKFFNDAYGHPVGDEVLCQVAGALRSCCRSYDTLSRYGGDEFAVLMAGVRSDEADDLEMRLRKELRSLGYRPPGYDTTIPYALSIGIAIFPSDGLSCLDVLHIADERLRSNKTGGQKNEAEPIRRALMRSVEGFRMLDALVTSVDSKDRYTRRHSDAVLIYGMRIAHALGFSEQEIQPLQIAALLHDVGKIGVPDGILRKPGRLSSEDMEAIKLHSTMGAAIVGSVPGFEEVLDTIRHHHERWDGTGYPHGLCGAAIPLSARLIAVADAYSAMISDRPYRKALDPEAAVAVLRAGAGTQWDPACVEAFLVSFS